MKTTVLLTELLTITESEEGQAELAINNDWVASRGLDEKTQKELVSALLTLMRVQLLKDLKNTPEEIKVPIAPESYIMQVSIAGDETGGHKVILKFGAGANSEKTLLECIAHTIKVVMATQSSLKL